MILVASRAILSAFQHVSACEGCPRAGRVKGWASQPSKYWNIYWYGPAPASMGEIMESFYRSLPRGKGTKKPAAALSMTHGGTHQTLLGRKAEVRVDCAPDPPLDLRRRATCRGGGSF